MSECIFCEIVAGKSPASVVYDDHLVMAFMTIGPFTPGHALVMPKAHIAFMPDLDEDLGMHKETSSLDRC